MAYSRKAIGLNQDVFGTQDYCLAASALSSEIFCERMRLLFSHGDVIRGQLRRRIPEICNMAFKAGDKLVPLIKAGP